MTRLGYVYAPLGGAYGFGLLVGGDDRFFSQSFNLMRDIMPWWAWGVTFLAYAVIMASSVKTNWDWAAMLLGAAPWGFVVASYFAAGLANPGISVVGASLYSMLILQHFAASWLLYRAHREEYAV